MMGTKQCGVAPLVNVSLENVVPADHFYRHVERTLDLSFVREARAADLCGRWTSFHRTRGVLAPLQLSMFFEEGICNAFALAKRKVKKWSCSRLGVVRYALSKQREIGNEDAQHIRQGLNRAGSGWHLCRLIGI
jgi:hypothetical protein